MISRYIDPKDIEPHYSTRFCRSHKIYLQDFYSPTLFSEICEELHVPEEYLLKDENWVSNSFVFKYFDKLIKKTGDKDIIFKIAKNFFDPNAISPLEYTLQKLIPPFLFYILYPIQASKLNLFSHIKATKIRPGHFVYQVKHEGDFHPELCSNMKGVLESSRDIFGLSSVEVTEGKCVHRGDTICEFRLSYSALTYWGKKASYTSLIATTLLLFYWILDKNLPPQVIKLTFIKVSLFSVLCAVATASLGLKIFALIRFNKSYYERSRQKNEELFEKNKKLDRRYQESNLLRDLSLKLVRLSNSKELIASSLDELDKRFGFERAIVMLIDSSISRLVTIDVRGFKEHTDMLFKLSFKYPGEKDNPQIFANILERGESSLIDNIEEFKKNLEPQNQLLLTAFGVRSLIVSPIQDAINKYGILVIGAIGQDKQLTNEDKHLIENMTRMMALFFQNARNFEKERTLKTLFQKYVPPVVIDGIRHLENGESGHLVPKNNAVSSIFVDMRDFTTISEALAPERVVEMLNLYIDYVSGFIAEEGGIIDNLVGDGVVAFFPAAEDDRSEHAKRALCAAIKILAHLDDMNRKLKDKGFPKARLGIGLHSGNATVGNVGSDRKMNYTAIGDTINLASRLESLCKEYSTFSPSSEDGLLIFSDGVYKRARLKVPCKELGKIKVRGRYDDVRVYCIDKDTALSINLETVETLSDEDLKAIAPTHLLTLGRQVARRRKDVKHKKRAG